MEEPARRGSKYLSVVAILINVGIKGAISEARDRHMRTFSSVCSTCPPSSASVGVDLIFTSSKWG
jgi:hypothetical protein